MESRLILLEAAGISEEALGDLTVTDISSHNSITRMRQGALHRLCDNRWRSRWNNTGCASIRLSPVNHGWVVPNPTRSTAVLHFAVRLENKFNYNVIRRFANVIGWGLVWGRTSLLSSLGIVTRHPLTWGIVSWHDNLPNSLSKSLPYPPCCPTLMHTWYLA